MISEELKAIVARVPVEVIAQVAKPMAQTIL